ncbi:MAG: sulfite exporter TauE/SafE family protein [Euryarchaeota archaeon]|jgi:hypothetical protein|nr:sulfite exporter TauE/SafE family protein [Euryarchaeota archaeon]
MAFEMLVVLVALAIVAALYSSVGHGGASGYLAILSLTSFGLLGSSWLKQHAWSMNLVVASMAFWHYYKAGYHVPKLTIPFIVASIPMALLGGYLRVDGVVYDTLLSVALIWAAWRLMTVKPITSDEKMEAPELNIALPIGGVIGLASGIVGVGGGIFLSPIILLKKWATPKTAAATSALFIWVNSAAGMVGAAVSGQLELQVDVLFPFIVAVLIGGYIGSNYGAKIASQNKIKTLLVIVLVVAAIRRILEVISN